jgi:hypothetical protein
MLKIVKPLTNNNWKHEGNIRSSKTFRMLTTSASPSKKAQQEITKMTIDEYNNALLQSGMAGDAEAMLKIFEDMKKSVTPNAVSFSTILQYLGELGNFDEIAKILKEDISDTIRAERIVTLLQSLGKNGRIHMMMSCYKRLKVEFGEYLNCKTYQVIVQSLTEANNTKLLWEIFHDIIEAKDELKSSILPTIGPIVKFFKKKKRPKYAITIYKVLQKRKLLFSGKQNVNFPYI